MFSGILRHLLGAYAALLFLLILSTHHSCSARNNNNYCTPSSCGNIHSISYPFRLNTDPESCGHKNYELICENNRPTLYFKGGKYYVQAINYKNLTIRFVDADVQKDDCCSLPQHSLNVDELNIDDIYSTVRTVYSRHGSGMSGQSLYGSYRLTFLTCANPILSAPFDIVNTSSCKSESTAYYNSTFNISSPSSHDMKGYSYVTHAHFMLKNLPNLCRVNLIYPVPASTKQNIETNMSYMDVHDILVYGFELSWFSACCNLDKKNRCDSFDEQATISRVCSRVKVTVGDKIKRAIADLSNLLLRNFVLVIRKSVRPLGKYIPGEFYTKYLTGEPEIYYSEDGKGQLQVVQYYNESSNYKTWTISSDLLSIPMLLFITLLLLNMIYRAILFFCGLPCLITFLIYKWRRRHLSMYDNIEEFLQSHDHNLMPVRYSYSEIKKITNGFKEKLGEGGFGSVYKGKLRSGRFAAIKILGNSKANGQDFMNEVASIGRIHHVNVVQLIGFTVEGSKRALVYEFMPNGSLEKYIFSKNDSIPLNNQKIYEISLGVARGIEYLHQGCDIQILHFDIKPHNILLDEKFVPKVSDFGLAKLYPADNNMVSLTAARGTIGYMAPEMLYKTIGRISYKADVYSFGMLLMDMIGRRKNWNALANDSCQTYFPSWVHDQVSKGKDIELEDHATEHEKRTTKKMIIVALWCIQLKPDDRPSMHKVVEMLEANIESLQMPPKPFFTPQHMPKDDHRNNPAKLSNPTNDCIDSSYQYGR